MKHRFLLAGVLAWLLLSAGAFAAETTKATVMQYQETEPGIGPYPVRILVTENYLRMDDGADAGDYLLVDRDKMVLYNINHENRNILVIPDSEIGTSDAIPEIKTLVTDDEHAPSIAGQAVKRVDVVADGKVCMTAFVVPTLLPGVTAALHDYQKILAARQYRDIELTPEAMRGPCFYANYLQGATRYLEHGLPVQWAIKDGRGQLLMDFHEGVDLPAELFTLPEGYQRYTLD